uniref:hypothetical protein n=1 Tax=uncultured Sphingomonas sp. TaxID=158754 RepID=UPI0035CACCD5
MPSAKPAPPAYVAIFRARDGATIYTDSRARLTDALGIRDGSQVGAIDEALLLDDRAGINIPARSISTALGL